MFQLIWPIMIVVGANTLYNLCTKSTPESINSFASLSVTYLLSSVLCLIMFFITSEQKNLLVELSKANWTTYALAISVIALEFGYICIYRAGWKMSTASLVANVSLACVLLFIGVFVYKESFSLKQLFGVLLCAGGLILICR